MKGPKDVELTQEKLRQATDALQLADAEGNLCYILFSWLTVLLPFSIPAPVNGQARETDAVKLMSVRAGLLDISHAWESLGNKCSVLAQSQKVC